MGKNRIELTGTIERLQAVTTKKGTSMARWLLCIGRDKFKCVAFKNVADAILQCSDGDHIAVNGSGSIHSWKDSNNNWHNDFQVSVWAAEINGQQVKYEKAEPARQQREPRSQQQQSRQQAPDDRDPGQFDYSGGPF